MKTTKILGLLLALGMRAFLSNASAQNAPVQLPKPGQYKGTLTVTTTLEDRPLGEGPTITMKKVVKASAHLDADGFIRIVYADDRKPIVGKFDAVNPTILYAHQNAYLLSFDARTISIITFGVSEFLLMPDEQPVPLNTQVKTQLKWVRK